MNTLEGESHLSHKDTSQICSPVTVQGSRSATEDDVTVYINKGNGAQIRSRKQVSFLLVINNVYFFSSLGSVKTGQGINRITDQKKRCKNDPNHTFDTDYFCS